MRLFRVTAEFEGLVVAVDETDAEGYVSQIISDTEPSVTSYECSEAELRGLVGSRRDGYIPWGDLLSEDEPDLEVGAVAERILEAIKAEREDAEFRARQKPLFEGIDPKPVDTDE